MLTNLRCEDWKATQRDVVRFLPLPALAVIGTMTMAHLGFSSFSSETKASITAALPLVFVNGRLQALYFPEAVMITAVGGMELSAMSFSVA